MDAQSLLYLLTAATSGLAAVIGFMGRKVISRLDNLESLMARELRLLDVRLSVVETHLGLRDIHSDLRK